MKPNLLLPILLLSLAFAARAAVTGAAAEWPQFRGPGGLAVSDARGLPTEWDAEKNIAWKAALPGPGASSPVVFGDKIFLTYYTGYGVDPDAPGEPAALVYHLACLSRADGKLLWDKEVKSAGSIPNYSGQITLHGYASSTPAVDADAVYVFFGTSGVFAWKHDGTPLWTQKVGDGTHAWGSSNSPVLYRDVVIINASVECKSIVGLDRKTGRELWRQPGIEMSWNTPIIVKAGARDEVVVSSKNRLKAYDPVKGTPQWECEGIQDYVCPSLVAKDGVVYAIGARKCAALAVKAGGKGDVTASHIVWRLDRGSNVSSPVLTGGFLFWADEKGKRFFCADAKTGKLVYEQAIDAAAAAGPKDDRLRIYASPIAADGNLYFLNRAGTAFVVKADRAYKLTAQNRFEGDETRFNASPAVSRGQLLVRSDQALYCIGKR